MANVIMFDSGSFETLLSDAGLTDKQIENISKNGTQFENSNYCIIELSTRLAKTGKEITITRKNVTVPGTGQVLELHQLNIENETPIEIDGPKIPPRLG